jgi:valyl-tRNA synthetase
MLGLKHNLKAIDTLDATGKFTATELAEDHPSELVLSYNGVDRFALRKKIVEDITALGQIEKIEDYKGQVGTSERTGAVIESRLSLQWFIDMQKFMAKNPEALESVMNDTIQFHPAKLKNTYSHWLSNIKDWCISRQLWWGQQIPAWYDEQGNVFVAATEEEAMQKAESLKLKAQGFQPSALSIKLTRDEDVLDTWFSSWLWPMEVFKGISNPGNNEIDYYYPTTTLVTGQDIIFFWVARMIMAGYEYKQLPPFKDVYFTGMVRDKQGRKMSKQLGNSPDLLGLIDQYGADAVRFGIMIASPAGNDLLFDESSLEQGRNFNNKLWNALKLVKMWKGRVDDSSKMTAGSNAPSVNSHLSTNNFAIDWFQNRLNEVQAEVDGLMKQFRLNEALKTLKSLIWDDFCSWYLEWVKPGLEQPVDAVVYQKTIGFFTELMQLLHPYMPFVTEEIYHLLQERNDDLCVKQLSAFETADKQILLQGNLLKEVITGVRDVRNKNQIKPKEQITLYIQTERKAIYQSIENILAKQLNTKAVLYVNDKVANAFSAVIGNDKFYIESEQPINTGSQKEDLLKDLAHQKGFLLSVEKKLSNEKFVQNARPEVLVLEQKKKDDALSRIKAIEESLAGL